MSKVKAAVIAQDLRKVVALLEANPDMDMVAAVLSFHTYNREDFLGTVNAVPRPFKKKKTDYGDFHITHVSEGLTTYSSAPQSVTCVLVKPAVPAVYDCLPLLTPEESSAIEEEL